MAAQPGLSGVRLVTGDKSLGMLGALDEVFPEARYQRCTVHFYRNVFAKVPRQKRTKVAKMLNTIERLNREIRRHTCVVGTFPDGRSALMLVTARLRYIVENEWGSRRYLDVSLLEEKEDGM